MHEKGGNLCIFRLKIAEKEGGKPTSKSFIFMSAAPFLVKPLSQLPAPVNTSVIKSTQKQGQIDEFWMTDNGLRGEGTVDDNALLRVLQCLRSLAHREVSMRTIGVVDLKQRKAELAMQAQAERGLLGSSKQQAASSK